ncbi:glycosyltransferase [Streptomyces sp. NPDC006739]|uniref:glycosyltransferase n=1 Tax=Streptomyces sp. NPDC006739 TaxID=3364763 RepID=UPI0036C4B9E1
MFAAHNEGQRLTRSLAACIESISDLDYEIVVVDDASTDGCVITAEELFPQIRTVRNEHRVGVSAAKDRGAREARGDVLVFLDGHTKPLQGSIERLVSVVELLSGSAVVTPRIMALDEERWELDHSRSGNGYFVDLLTLDCGWLGLEELRVVRESGLRLHESPALIGCALAVDRKLYARLYGFDPRMLSWGVEDLDLSIKCWLLGHRILHDQEAVVGHRFRDAFDDYDVQPDHLLHNQIRTAFKNYGHAAFGDWLEARRLRENESLEEHPEGLWARSWQLFGEQRASAEQERGYLHARRVRDEIWYARRFGLDWPRLGGAPAEALSFPLAAGPSPSPPPCSVSGVTPGTVTVPVGAAVRFTAQGQSVASVSWTTAPPGTPASGNGASFAPKWTTAGAKQVTASCGASSASATATVVAVTPVLTPHDNFTGRSTTRFGIGEIIDLSFRTVPGASAAQLGGLRWSITSGGGTLTGTAGNDGIGVFTAAGTPGSVTLALKVVGGPAAGATAATRTITVVAPSDALMAQKPGTGIKHTTGTWSVGFLGEIFMRPTDVSFAQAVMREGTVAGVGSGYLAGLNGIVHPLGGIVTIGTGDAAKGSKVNGTDTVNSGNLGTPFSAGDFLWAIPWLFGLTGTTPATQFTTANHHMTADSTGRATIEKKGAGPFSRVPADPTTNF